MKGSRNAPCPCGSGRKYKRCCLAKAQRIAAAARRDDAIGGRIGAWSVTELADELELALVEFGRTRPLSGTDVELFNTWFHNDRRLADGSTPAELYARRDQLDPSERDVAARVASSRLGIHQVVEATPGVELELVDQLHGTRTRVASRNVSQDLVRWDFLLARVMEGDPATLWGPARPLGAAEGDELLAELGRLARAAGVAEDRAGLESSLRRNALALFRFVPPSATAERSFHTLEGDPLLEGSARWALADPARARARLAQLGGIEAGESVEEPAWVDITAPRSTLLAQREKELPLGALVIEKAAGLDGSDEVVATVTCEGSSLLIEAMSEQRLVNALRAVAEDFGDVLGEDHPEVRIASIEDRLAEVADGRLAAAEPEQPPDGLTPAEEQRILGDFLVARYRGWLDEPNPSLDGATPRKASRDGRRDEVVKLARRAENGAARSARDGGVGREIDLLGELDLGDAA